MSRLHLGMGVMSYLASPLWLLFMLVGLIAVLFGGLGVPADPFAVNVSPIIVGLVLYAVVMLMLLTPKFYAVCLVLQRPDVMRAHGGELQAVLGALLEVFISVLIAPLMMLYHTQFVVNTLLGRSVKWNAQQRDETAVDWTDAVRNHWKHTVAGLVAGALIFWLTPSLFIWTLPVLLGLVVSIPVCVLLSSVRIGAWLRDRGLLMIPEEFDKPRVLRLHQAALTRTQAVAAAALDAPAPAAAPAEPVAAAAPFASLFDRVVRDPLFHRFHLAALAANSEPFESPVDIPAALDLAGELGLIGLDKPQQIALLSTPTALRRLHHRAWAG
jgi:membrane glycosyltransferase